MDSTCGNQCILDAIISLKNELSDLKSSKDTGRVLSNVLFNDGDTAWVLSATTLVLFMTIPGLVLYYAGMVRVQHILSLTGAVFSIFCIISVLWFAVGYSIAFAPVDGTASPIYGDGSRLWLVGMSTDTVHQNAPTIPEPIYCAYELAFAIITSCLVCGSIADRMKYWVMMLFSITWHLVVYCPIAHASWHPDGFLFKAGVLDAAGA
jgi:Amt family ammonium transporter